MDEEDNGINCACCGDQIKFREPNNYTTQRVKNFHIKDGIDPEAMLDSMSPDLRDWIQNLAECMIHIFWEEEQLPDLGEKHMAGRLSSEIIDTINQFKLEARAAYGEAEALKLTVRTLQ